MATLGSEDLAQQNRELAKEIAKLLLEESSGETGNNARFARSASEILQDIPSDIIEEAKREVE